MSVTQKEIKTLARLSRLEFSDEEIEKFAPEFEEIIEFANRINEQVEGDTGSIREVVSRTVKWEDLREDEVKESLPNEKITSNVQAEGGYFPERRGVKRKAQFRFYRKSCRRAKFLRHTSPSRTSRK